MSSNANVSKLEELKKRVFFTILMLGVYRVATQVPTPGVDGAALSSFFDNMQGSLFSVFNTFSGGALERFSVLALGIMPYITSSIIFSLLSYSIPALAELQKEPDGHKKIQQYTRYATVLLCFFQGYGLAVGLENIKSPNGLPVVIDPGMSFRLLTVISLTAGTMFVMWLGEQITERGIGNGISLIIFAGIVVGLPRAIFGLFEQIRTGNINILTLFGVLVFMFAIIALIVFVERAQRRIPVQYAKRVVGRRVYGGQNTYLPLRVNTSGVIPIIFAISILQIPYYFSNFIGADWMKRVASSLSQGQPLYVILYAVGILFFCYFYTSIVFNPTDTADNMRK